MSETKLVHVLREPFDIYIGRKNSQYDLPQSPWANPFVIGKDGTREEVIEQYRDWIQTQPKLLEMLPELKGKTLACWCKTAENPLPCHGEVLIGLLDTPPAAPAPKLKLAVVGSRSFTDRARLYKILDNNIDRIKMIISGGAKGVDSMATDWATERGIPFLVFPAKWRDKNGVFDRGAGMRRNWQIIRECNYCTALWDQKSVGTSHSIEIANTLKKPLRIYTFDPATQPPDA